MPITILQQPQALTFVGNIPDLIVETSGVGMTVNITKGATLILAEYYSADEAGRARVLLRDFLNDFLHLDLPTADVDLYEQTRSVAQFGVEILVGSESTSFSFIALKGGSSTINLDCAAYLKESWLTWQPQIKRVKDIQPEWLSYYAQAAAVVKIKGYFSGGTSETITLHTLEAGKHYSINMTFADLREEFVDQPIYIDAWVENSGGTAFSTYVQRFLLTDEFFEWDDYFLFKNSVGGLDLIRFTGTRETTNPVEVDSALFYDEFERDFEVTPRMAFEKNTGYFRSRAELLWSLDFFQAKEKYYLIGEEFAEIRLLNPEYVAPENTLTSLDFKFSYTRQTLYLSLFKKKSPLIDPIIIGPGDDDYYLPPNIGEFPQQTDPSGLLFPVQKPGTPGWFFITWENMLAEILENLPSGVHNELDGLQGGNSSERYHLTQAERDKVQSLPESFIENHNDLANIQGGDVGERYHLTEEQHATLTEINRTSDEGGDTIRHNFPAQVSGSPASNPDEFVTLEQLEAVTGPQGTQLRYGGVVQWTGVGFNYIGYPSGYDIEGVPYTVGQTPLVLDAADPSLDRRDRFKLTVNGWEVDKGTPGAGVAPSVNLITEIDRGDAIVLAGATSPTVPTNEPVYTENEAGEWAGSHTGSGTGNPNSTSNPDTGSKSYEVTNVIAGSSEVFTRSANLPIENIDSLRLRVALKSNMNQGRSLRIQFLSEFDTPVSNLVAMTISRNTTAFQDYAISKAQMGFAPSATHVRKFRVTYSGTGGPAVYAGYFLDNIIIQGGAVTQPENPINELHNELQQINGGETAWRGHLNKAQWDAIEASSGDSPGPSNRYITVSLLNSYAYVQEAPINGSPHYRKDGAWVAFTPGIQHAASDGSYYASRNGAWAAFTPFTVAGTPAEGNVVTWSSGAPTWAALSGGGGSKWSDLAGGHIYRNSKVIVGTDSNIGGATFAVKMFGDVAFPHTEQFTVDRPDGARALSMRAGGNFYYSFSNFFIGVSSGLDANNGTFYHRSGQTSAIAGTAFRFDNGAGEMILQANHQRVISFGNPTLSIGTTLGNLGIRQRAGTNGNGGSQFLLEDNLGVSNFNVDNIGRVTVRGSMAVNGLGVNRSAYGFGLAITGTNDGVDAFQLYTQGGTTLVTYYRRTTGWVFKGFGTGNEVIHNLQDSTGAERFKYLANGRMFLYNLPTTAPAAGTKEVYVDASGFLKLA